MRQAVKDLMPIGSRTDALRCSIRPSSHLADALQLPAAIFAFNTDVGLGGSDVAGRL